MKKIFLIFLIAAANLPAQSFKVEKVSGNVSVQKGASEKWEPVKKGITLDANDFIQTGDKSSVQLSNGKEKFILKSSSAIMPGSIRKISQNDLLLALTVEEIKSLPNGKKDTKTKSTAVYGTKLDKNNTSLSVSNIGIKRLNGAMQLAENGFMESSVIVAKETFRKYPETKILIKERIYFAGVLEKLSLFEEALKEYNRVASLEMSAKEKSLVSKKIDELNKKLE
jgi:hypothetical protein